MRERNYDWRTVVRAVDPELETRMTSVTSYVSSAGDIPKKYKELITMACAAGLRYGSSVRAHAQRARDHGATNKEIVEALGAAAMVCGFPSMIEATESIGDLLGESPNQS